VALGLGLGDGALKIDAWKQLEQLAEDAAESHKAVPPGAGAPELVARDASILRQGAALASFNS
jgi:hypothetical protein